MKKEDFITDSLVDIYETSNLAMIQNSETSDKYGRKLNNYYIAAVPDKDMYRVYQLTLLDNAEKKQVVVSLSVVYFKEPKYGANKNNLLMYIPNYYGTQLGYVKFNVPEKAWDQMRNGILAGIFDFVDSDIAEKCAVSVA